MSSTPLLLTVRFSSSHPDIHLDIPSPATTPTAALKLLIRAQLPPSFSHRRLRFIYRGRILEDTAALSLIIPPPPPPLPPPLLSSHDASALQDSDDDDDDDDETRGKARAKGKGKAIDSKGSSGGSSSHVGGIILNCAIGTPDAPLSAAELAAEERTAHLPPAARAPGAGAAAASHTPPPRPAPSPRGFDRLLNAGLSRTEIAQLRTHFTALQARRHTPDAMPSPDSLRRMEDAWIDGNVGGGAATGAATAAAGAAPGLQTMMDVDEDAGGGQFGVMGMLDGLVSGMAVGFFFPVGAMVWVIRQDGMVAHQESVYVVLGLVLAVATGLMRGFAGDADET